MRIFLSGFFNRFFVTLIVKLRMMTTITIKNGDLKKTIFKDPKDLFNFLTAFFADETVMVKTSVDDLTTEQFEAWKQHKKEGYTGFVDLK